MENNNQPQPVLVGQGGPLNGFRWTISKTLLIGRTSSCDISIANQQVSRKHAKIESSANGPVLEDLGSKNGTLINYSSMKKKVLQPGDKIILGRIILKFEHRDLAEQKFFDEI